MGESSTSQRIDLWLWCVRVMKTRALAQAACTGGRVSVDGRRAKPSTKVRPGSTVTLSVPGGERQFLVLDTASPRMAASLVPGYATETTPQVAHLAQRTVPAPPVTRERGLGRPTKRDRRKIDQLRREGGR